MLSSLSSIPRRMRSTFSTVLDKHLLFRETTLVATSSTRCQIALVRCSLCTTGFWLSFKVVSAYSTSFWTMKIRERSGLCGLHTSKLRPRELCLSLQGTTWFRLWKRIGSRSIMSILRPWKSSYRTRWRTMLIVNTWSSDPRAGIASLTQEACKTSAFTIESSTMTSKSPCQLKT